MTVSTTTRSQSFAGGQSVLDFNFDTIYNVPTNILVNVVSGSTITALVYGVGYTVTINSSGVGGVVTVSPTYSSAYTYVVYRMTPQTQTSQYTDYNQFPAATLMSNLDQLTMLVQEQSDNYVRTLSLPIGTSTSISTIIPVPVSVTSGTLVLGWDPTGKFLENIYAPSIGSLLASTAAQAQAGTDNTTYITPTMCTVAMAKFVPSYAVTSVSSSTADITVVSTSTTPIITSVNAATGGSNSILRLNSSGYLPVGFPYIKISNTQTQNVSSGVSVANSWSTMPINTKDNDTASIATLSNSTLTLPSGTYQVKASNLFYCVPPYNGPIGLRIYSPTPGTVLINGQNNYTDNNGYVYTTTAVNLFGMFTITGSTNIVLQYYVVTASTTVLGYPMNVGTEVYAVVELSKVS